MKAAVVERYGPPSVVTIADLPVPTPRKNEVLVRVRSVAVTAGDARIRAALFPSGFGILGRLAFGLRRPRRAVLGNTFSGTVASLGVGVADLAIGDEVCGMTGLRMGAHAEYVAAPRAKLVAKPGAVSHDEAAAVLFGGSTALYYLEKKATVRAGDKVLVNGASGAVGSAAVQLARNAGAIVTGVASAANADLVRALGAEQVVDYTTTPLGDFDGRYDVVLDAVGNVTPATGLRLLTDEGVLLLAVAGLRDTLVLRRKVKAGPAPESAEAFARLLQLVADGQFKAVMDHTDVGGGIEAITAAYERIDSGRKVGNLVIHP
jgi:NADPH:quinone reductase-like Zn-dependent oxidoreductase